MQPMHVALWLLYFAVGAAIFFTTNTLQTSLAVDALGIALLVGGGWLMVWSKYWLGRQYERLPTSLKEGHVLVMNGPYAIVRHPEYVGLVLAYLGLSLVLKSWLGVILSVASILPVHACLAVQEEMLLEAHFKDRYKQYKERISVLPGIRKLKEGHQCE